MGENFDSSELRDIMDYVVDTEKENHDDVLLVFVENSIFLEALAHHWHLQCHWYSKHMELDEFYKELPEYVDTFIEGLMATRGALPIGTGHAYTFQTLDQCIPVLQDYVQQAKHIHELLDSQDDYGSVNSLEDIISFVERILYKLTVLN